VTAPAVFPCPKCHGAMRSYERSGIVLEQCEECRGIFLDHGELERFVDAEGGGWSGRVGAPRPEWQPEPATGDSPGTGASAVRAEHLLDRRTERIAALRDLFGDES
jgi:Zn-finger nucleic acid-binding protein